MNNISDFVHLTLTSNPRYTGLRFLSGWRWSWIVSPLLNCIVHYTHLRTVKTRKRLVIDQNSRILIIKLLKKKRLNEIGRYTRMHQNNSCDDHRWFKNFYLWELVTIVSVNVYPYSPSDNYHDRLIAVSDSRRFSIVPFWHHRI